MRRRIVLLAIFSLLIGGSVFLVTRKLASQQTGRKAFTVFLVEIPFKGMEPSREMTSFQIYAQKGDGSRVTITNRFSGEIQQWGFLKDIVDIRGRTNVGTDSWTGSKTSHPLSEASIRYYSTPRTSCTQDSQAEHGKMLGYDVVKEVKQFGADPVVHSERWLAPALDCFPLSMVGTMGRAMGNQLTADGGTTRQAIWVTEGDPSDSLFGWPADYVERKPSEVDAAFYRRSGRHITSPERLPGLDQRYLSSQQSR